MGHFPLKKVSLVGKKEFNFLHKKSKNCCSGVFQGSNITNNQKRANYNYRPMVKTLVNLAENPRFKSRVQIQDWAHFPLTITESLLKAKNHIKD